MTPKQFIEERHGSADLAEAARQETQLAYLTESQVQDDYLNPEYMIKWAERKYETADYFLNYVKSVFKTENFLTFFKFLRFPLPSSKVINNKVTPDLKRVFQADDSCFDYAVANVEKSDYLEELDPMQFNKDVFDAMMGKHNSILLTDMSSESDNTPIRSVIPIENVVSILLHGDKIKKIAIGAQLPVVNGETTDIINGFYYVDGERYAFLNKNLEIIKEEPHDLKYCPAHFIAARRFGSKAIVRESIFSYIREELEEFNFLKTMQKMTEPNGAIPVTTYLKSKTKSEANRDFQSDSMEPGDSEVMSSQRAGVTSSVPPSGKGLLQIGTALGVPAVQKEGGGLDMDAVKNFITFHYMPVASLEYLKARVNEVERAIIINLIGDVTESSESAKNEMQIRKSVIVLENTLNQLSDDLSRIRNLGDTDFLGLKYGIDRVEEVTTFYGSDFFLETVDQLLTDFNAAPNPVERKNILNRLTESRYKNNPEKLERQFILNNLMPFVSDVDFDKAISKGLDDMTFALQNRFTYWIQQFEAMVGDIVIFFNSLGEVSNAAKFTIINNIILTIIDGNTKDQSVRGPEAPVRQERTSGEQE